jgi:glucosamine 6-phosphate synthetase-like amidotransferase/phosphosugar isomerase protein
MCGIVGYVGNRAAYPIIIKGLKRLEYRGYDSAGIALLNCGLQLVKTKGKVADLEEKAKQNSRSGTLGIGHTRWATHGIPNDVNAHPHTSNSGRLVLVHNGIIENYKSLRAYLTDQGFRFSSETDTEVLVNLIEHIQITQGLKTGKAVQIALNQVVGAYAIAVFDKERPKEISYIHAEGYPAAEMKHGPIALIDKNMPVVVIATNKGHYEKVVSNIQEIKSRDGKIIAVVTKGDRSVKALADHVIEIPEVTESLTPILASVPLQLLAYHIAVMRGCNVDQPRNLAKSVTVE